MRSAVASMSATLDSTLETIPAPSPAKPLATRPGGPQPIDPTVSQFEDTRSWLAEARRAGSSATDAARAMRSVRRNKRAEAEEAFGVRVPLGHLLDDGSFAVRGSR